MFTDIRGNIPGDRAMNAFNWTFNVLDLLLVAVIEQWPCRVNTYMQLIGFPIFRLSSPSEGYSKVKVKVKFFIMLQTLKCTRGRKHETYTYN